MLPINRKQLTSEQGAAAIEFMLRGSDQYRFDSIPRLGGLRLPLDAVRAAIVTEHRAKQ